MLMLFELDRVTQFEFIGFGAPLVISVSASASGQIPDFTLRGQWSNVIPIHGHKSRIESTGSVSRVMTRGNRERVEA